MTMKKKILLSTITVALAATATIGFTACNGDTNTNNSTNSSASNVIDDIVSSEVSDTTNDIEAELDEFSQEILDKADSALVSLANNLMADYDFSMALLPCEEEMGLELYGLTGHTVDGSLVYVGVSTVPDEVAVFKPVSEESRQLILDAINTRLEVQKQNFENYLVDQVPKIENAQVFEQDGLIAVVVGDKKA